MSSPVHHADDLDPALYYAPPQFREQAGGATQGSVSGRSINARPPWRGSAGQRRGLREEVALARLQQQFALDPEKVPEPPFDARRNAWPLVRRICAVGGTAAVVAWGLVWLPIKTKPAEAPHIINETVPAEASHVASEAPRVAGDAPPVASEAPRDAGGGLPVDGPSVPAVNRVKIVHVTASGDMATAAAKSLTPQAEPQSTETSPPEPAPPVAQAEPNAVALSGDELAALVKRGETYLANGDFASARLLLRRAAAAGSADAALSLGATFDPLVIKQLGAIGAEPDIERARKWYEAASKLGSQAASQQLARLADAQR